TRPSEAQNVKLPALCIAAAFSGGVALGLYTPLDNLAASATAGRFFVCVSLALLTACAILFLKNRILFACGFSLLVWLNLGLFAAWTASQPGPANHVLRLAESRSLDLSVPLRWHASLRDEPAEIPGGISYDLSLASIDYNGSSLPIAGGMRLSYFEEEDSESLLALHA